MIHLYKTPVLCLVLLIAAGSLQARQPDDSESNPLERSGRNAVYVEMLGNAINLLSINYERSLQDNLHARIGFSYFSFSDELRYEDRGDDLFVDVFSIPASVSYTLFEGVRQLELGLGLTYVGFSFNGGPYDLGYEDVELGNRYRGLALTSIISYRVSVSDYLFRIGLYPYYMITIDSELTGFFHELDDRGAINLNDFLDLRGFQWMPGLSFGRSF